MKPNYQIRLTAKNEGIYYRDEMDVYRFNVHLSGREWIVQLPGSKGDNFEKHALTQEEKERILPRLTQYLSLIRWFGIFPRSYTVSIIKENEISRR